MSVFNRLYSHGQDRLKKLEESQRKRSTQKDPNCTFAPVTNHTSSSSSGRASRKRRRPKPTPRIKDVLEAIVQTVEAGADLAGAVSIELYGQILANTMSSIRDRQSKEAELAVETEDRQSGTNTTASSKHNGERFKSLYKDAQDKRVKASKLQRENSSRLPADCTFSPRINRYKGAGQNDSRSRGDKLYEELYKGARRHLEKKDKLHAEAKQRAPQHCTFKPRINRISGNNTSSTSGQSRFSRLYDDGAAKRKQRKDEIAARKLEVERLRREEDTIAPLLPESIAASRGVMRMKKIRIKARETSKVVTIRKVQQAKTTGPEATDNDADVPESDSTTPEKKKSRSFFSRRKKSNKVAKKKKKKISKVREASLKKKKDKAKAKSQGGEGGRGAGGSKDGNREAVAFNSSLPQVNKRTNTKRVSDARIDTVGLEQCTFSPQICRTGPKDKREGTVFTRLQKQSKARQERARQREKANPHGCTFKPAITPVAGGERESQTKRFERLYKDHEKRLKKHGSSKTKLPLGCTFAPDVTLSKSTFENNGEVEVARKPARPKKPKSIVEVDRPNTEGRVLVSVSEANVSPGEKTEPAVSNNTPDDLKAAKVIVTEALATEAMQSIPEPAEPKSLEVVETESAEAKYIEANTRPDETKPVETKPAESKRATVRSDLDAASNAKPAKAAPEEAKYIETKAKRDDTKPVESEPAVSMPADRKSDLDAASNAKHAKAHVEEAEYNKTATSDDSNPVDSKSADAARSDLNFASNTPTLGLKSTESIMAKSVESKLTQSNSAESNATKSDAKSTALNASESPVTLQLSDPNAKSAKTG